MLRGSVFGIVQMRPAYVVNRVRICPMLNTGCERECWYRFLRCFAVHLTAINIFGLFRFLALLIRNYATCLTLAGVAILLDIDDSLIHG